MSTNTAVGWTDVTDNIITSKAHSVVLMTFTGGTLYFRYGLSPGSTGRHSEITAPRILARQAGDSFPLALGEGVDRSPDAGGNDAFDIQLADYISHRIQFLPKLVFSLFIEFTRIDLLLRPLNDLSDSP